MLFSYVPGCGPWGMPAGCRLLGSDHPEVKSSIRNLAIMQRKRGDEAGAQTLERELLAKETVESKSD